MTRDELSMAHMRATEQRAATEQFATAFRQHVANWRKEEAERNPVMAALLFGHNEAWNVRLERFLASVEAHATNLRNQEAQFSKALAELPAPAPEPAAPAPTPPIEPAPTKKPRRRAR